ncbi:MAG: glycosyltransferase [Acidimicrobiales bacterium]
MRLDLVIPAHNEEHRIGQMLTDYRAAMGPETRLLVALDHCTDGTAEVVRSHSALDGRIVAHEYAKLGKGGVIMEAFRHCDADLVGFVDADGATPPTEIARLASAASRPGVDMAIASRRHPSALVPVPRSASRRASSAAFAALVRAMFGMRFEDTQCGAKVARRQVVEACLPLLSSRDLMFDVDMLVTAERLGFRVVEVPTIWIDREGSTIKLGNDSALMALSSLRLWLHQTVMPVPSGAGTPGDNVIDLREHRGPARPAPVRSNACGEAPGDARDA